MGISRIFHPGKLKIGTEITLLKQASIHLLRVLRLKIGEEVILFNGEGGQYLGKLSSVKQKSAVIEINDYQATSVESPLKIHLGQAISRGERMDFVIQKATELGITQVTPLLTERCNVKLPTERLEKRIEHWRAVSISACEQSGRCELPRVSESQSITSWLTSANGLRLICDLQGEASFFSLDKAVSEVSLLIGPEGGLTEEEIQSARKRGFQPLALGPRVLRTETAALVAITLIQSRWGDLT